MDSVGVRPSARFTTAEHIRRRQDFERVYEHGRRVHGKFMTIVVVRNGLQGARLGIAATRKLGGAVVRNRAKRLARELFRRNKIAAAFDLVVIPRREMVDAEFGTLEADYRSLLRRGLPR